jgi:hypothetical protein
MLSQYFVVKVPAASRGCLVRTPERRCGATRGTRGAAASFSHPCVVRGARAPDLGDHLAREGLVEPGGLEPPTSALQRRRSPG